LPALNACKAFLTSSKAHSKCLKMQSQIRCVVYEAITIKNACQLRQSPISCGRLSAGKRRTRWKHAFISRASCLSMLNGLFLIRVRSNSKQARNRWQAAFLEKLIFLTSYAAITCVSSHKNFPQKWGGCAPMVEAPSYYPAILSAKSALSAVEESVNNFLASQSPVRYIYRTPKNAVLPRRHPGVNTAYHHVW